MFDGALERLNHEVEGEHALQQVPAVDEEPDEVICEPVAHAL